MRVTPLQMAMVAATIGNNEEVLIAPFYIVERVVRANGSEIIQTH
jgi:cell division protein FtsI/penicillin-binding protein 2